MLNCGAYITMYGGMKKLFLAVAFILLTTAFSIDATAQVGFQPEFLGNANASRPGFALKFFPSYFYQNAVKAHDVETAFEPQFWIPGFTGDTSRDQLQFVIHVPVGYRIQNSATGGKTSVTGLGTVTTAIEYYWHLVDTEDFEVWFDNGIVGGWPTATNNKGVSISGHDYSMRIGSDSFSVGWYQENFIRYKKWIFTISPIAVSWGFRDSDSKVRNGLAVTLMNNAIGYQVASWAHLGLNMGMQVSNIVGDESATGGNLPNTWRAWAGPAGLFGIDDNTSLQMAILIDAYTKNVNRGQGIFFALWHHF